MSPGDGWTTTADVGWSAALNAAITTLGSATTIFKLIFFDLNGDGLVDMARDDWAYPISVDTYFNWLA